MTNVLVANGQGVLVSAVFALGLAFLVSVALSGVEILIDTWLRSRAGARTVKNVQMVFSITGLLSFYAVLAACFASGPSFPWVNWLAVRLPGSFGQPLGELALSPISTIAGIGITSALVLGLGGFFGGEYLMRAGLLSGNVQQAKTRGILGKDLRKSGLLRFECLLLLRDRALATQVVMVPFLLVVYQLLVNPTMIAGATVGGICAMAYGCGTYASMITAPQLLMSESRGIWLIYNLPVPIAAYFRRRELVLRSVATFLAGLFVVAMIFWSKSFHAGDIWRYLAALMGVWVMGRMVSGIVMGKPEMPDVASGERPKISFGRMYGAMILAGMYGAMMATGLCIVVAWLWLGFLSWGNFLGGSKNDFGVFEGNPWVFWLLAVVAAPLIEEPLFRGFVCRTMMGFWSRTQAIVGSALVFAIVHPGPSFPPVFLLGLATAVLYARSRSLVPGIVLHALYNLGVLTMATMG